MSTYSTKLGQQICERTACSSIGLRHICKELGIAYSTVTNWIYDEDHELHAKYAKAKVMQLGYLAEEILEIADDSSNDYMTVVKNGKTKQVLNREAISRSNLRIRARLALIAKLSPILRTNKITPKEKQWQRIIFEKIPPDEMPAKENNSSPKPQYEQPGGSPAGVGSSPKNQENIADNIASSALVYPGSSPKTTPAAQGKISRSKNVKTKKNTKRKTQKKIRRSSPKNTQKPAPVVPQAATSSYTDIDYDDPFGFRASMNRRRNTI